jgi:hypothetical protein
MSLDHRAYDAEKVLTGRHMTQTEIQLCSTGDLRAIVKSTNPHGSFWKERSYAQEELDRRALHKFRMRKW